MKTGYCCNVHGGITLDEVKANLERYACEVKRRVSPTSPMPVGLWLSESAIEGLGDDSPSKVDATQEFGDWLASRGLEPFTFNGFPQGNFHQEVVKQDVYLPTWAEASRLEYTKKLAVVQSMLLERFDTSSDVQTISTLPLGWPPIPKEQLFSNGQDFLTQCGKNLQLLAASLAELKQESGHEVVVCIEPEPGCCFDTCHDVVKFFREYLFAGNSDSQCEMIRKHIGVCHDVCHSTVMFEDQETAVTAYKDAGIQIGKVQVSSAIKVKFDRDADVGSKLEQLTRFSEPRYLHQTSIRNKDQTDFYDDLGAALSAHETPEGEWRVHFHVPIFAQQLGDIDTTQDDILAFLSAVKRHDVDIPHYEIETYAWNVLPEEHKNLAGDLASGIAEEVRWFLQQQ